MAVKTVTQYSCDRCKKTYAEEAPKATHEKMPPALHLELTVDEARQAVLFQDLCPKCKGRVADLVKQIKLETEDKPEGDKGTEKTKPAEKPPTGEKPKTEPTPPVDVGSKPGDNKGDDKPKTDGKPPAKA